jgi:hypothetical protein
LIKRAILPLLLGCYHWSLRLYPAAFRIEFGAEMEAVFASAVKEAAEEGPGAVLSVCLKETADFPFNLADAYKQVPFFPGVGVMKREASWNVWPLWVALNLLAIPLASLAVMALVVLARLDRQEPVNIVQAVLYVSMMILVSAVLQWLLLRRYLENAAVWIPLTAVGWLAGIFMIYLARPAVEAAPSGRTLTLVLLLLGAVVGLAQWIYLRRMVDHAGYWVLASATGYGVLGYGASVSFTSIAELLFFILAPFAITGLALVILLRQGDVTENKKLKTENGKRFSLTFIVILFMIPLFFAGSWVYATGQLTLAKAKGIYATPEEGMKQILLKGAGDNPVERIEIRLAGVDNHDGSQPHVWFVSAWVFADQRPDGKPTPRGYGGGSYFLRVEEGWVHVPEGAFPNFIGWVMGLYSLEGA